MKALTLLIALSAAFFCSKAQQIAVNEFDKYDSVWTVKTVVQPLVKQKKKTMLEFYASRYEIQKQSLASLKGAKSLSVLFGFVIDGEFIRSEKAEVQIEFASGEVAQYNCVPLSLEMYHAGDKAVVIIEPDERLATNSIKSMRISDHRSNRYQFEIPVENQDLVIQHFLLLSKQTQ